jgi:hypothetical protein
MDPRAAYLCRIGIVTASPETVRDTSYEPLSRPLFLYVSPKALARPEIRSFIRYAISPDRSSVIRETGYVRLPPVSLLVAARRLDRNVTGSIFGGRCSVLGVTADMFADEDEVQECAGPVSNVARRARSLPSTFSIEIGNDADSGARREIDRIRDCRRHSRDCELPDALCSKRGHRVRFAHEHHVHIA